MPPAMWWCYPRLMPSNALGYEILGVETFINPGDPVHPVYTSGLGEDVFINSFETPSQPFDAPGRKSGSDTFMKNVSTSIFARALVWCW